MSSVGTLTRPSSIRPSIRQAAGVALAAVFAVLALTLVLALVRGPRFVEHLTIENRSNLEVHVVASSTDDDGSSSLAVVDPDQRTRLDDVLDQGDTWQFRLSRGRTNLGMITMTRAELADAGWNVVIPASVGRD